jgi:hypothetical protein
MITPGILLSLEHHVPVRFGNKLWCISTFGPLAIHIKLVQTQTNPSVVTVRIEPFLEGEPYEMTEMEKDWCVFFLHPHIVSLHQLLLEDEDRVTH